MHSCICGSCGSDWSMWYADTHKGASMSAARIYRLLLSGCGGTRATFALLHGHLIRSFVLHPFVPYTAILGGWFMLSQTLQRISRGRLHIGMHFRPLYMWLALALIVVNCIVKNMLILFCGIHLLK